MKRILTATLALALLLPVSTMAQPGGKGRRMCCSDGPAMMMGKHAKRGHRPRMGIRRLLTLADELQLTEKQQGDLEQMATKFQMEKIDRQASLKKAQVQLKALMRDDAPEADVIRAIDEAARLKADLQKMQYSHMKQAKSVLTDKQIQRLKELRKERMDKMCNRDAKMEFKRQSIMEGHGRGRGL